MLQIYIITFFEAQIINFPTPPLIIQLEFEQVSYGCTKSTCQTVADLQIADFFLGELLVNISGFSPSNTCNKPRLICPLPVLPKKPIRTKIQTSKTFNFIYFPRHSKLGLKSIVSKRLKGLQILKKV